jgi:hypothetical protein
MAEPLNLSTFLSPSWTNYDEGQLIRHFADAYDVTKVKVDPSALQVTIQAPDYTQTNYIYGTHAELVKDAVGQYHVDINLNAGGVWIVRWEASGSHQGISERKITADPSDLA